MRDDRAVASPGPPNDARGGAAAMLMRRVDCLRSSGGAKAAPPMRAFSCDVVTGPNVTRRLLMMTTPHASLFPLCLQQTLHELCSSRHFFNRRTNRHNFPTCFFPAGETGKMRTAHCIVVVRCGRGVARSFCHSVRLAAVPQSSSCCVILGFDHQTRERESELLSALRNLALCGRERESVWLSRTTR